MNEKEFSSSVAKEAGGGEGERISRSFNLKAASKSHSKLFEIKHVGS